MKEMKILMKDYTYNLPDARIAKYPLEKRDESKLLIYKYGEVSESIFKNISNYLPSGSLMVFNNTKVVPARMFFKKDTGAIIEIFCLEPCSPMDYVQAFDAKGSSRWKVIVGNIKRWKHGKLSAYLHADFSNTLLDMNLKAELISRDAEIIVEFTWNDKYTFSEILENHGKIPIPPYLNRESEAIDTIRYQTTYAKRKGSVAAPTAGLHFTPKVLEDLKAKGIIEENVCLHVGAGTFLPVKSKDIIDHTMHKEPFIVSLDLLEKLNNKSDNQKVIAVGTTSTRTLESLYYLGLDCYKQGPINWTPRTVEQWAPYNHEGEEMPSLFTVTKALIEYMKINDLQSFMTRTQIIIVPSYKFQVVDILVTNFHQPHSTLLLLIAAFIGEDWQKAYDYAMKHDFRFLSYGDSCLMFR
ncbi:MAG: S-adenosylmethionine:tRNA ribosyltransferase-isomerase [Bacteroidales bacterium]